MIDFTKDGPFSKTRGPQSNRLRMIGLGQMGACVLDHIVLHGREPYDLSVIDTDQQTIESSVVSEKLLVGLSMAHGLGCGGDLAFGCEIADASETELAAMVGNCDYLLIVVGLAGGTGAALAPTLVRLAQANESKVIVVASMPFDCESRRRQQQARHTLKNLRETADAVLVFSNERLLGLPAVSSNLRQGYYFLNQLIGQSMEALAQLLCKRGVLQLSFADVRSLYGRFHGLESIENCWIGSGEMNPETDLFGLLDQVMGSPLFDDNLAWQNADHALVSLSGGAALSLSEVQELLSELQKRMPREIPVSAAASLDDHEDAPLRITLLLANTTAAEIPAESEPSMPDKEFNLESAQPEPQLVAEVEVEMPEETPAPESEPVPDEPRRPSRRAPRLSELPVETDPKKASQARARKHVAKQEELPFDSPQRGRFEKAFETIYRGENLDQPTFRRRRLQIRV